MIDRRNDRSWIAQVNQSEELFCYYSEKLAMIWSMMKIESGTIVRIVEDLLVYGNCHTVTKFISRIRNCDFIVRDASRYIIISKMEMFLW